MDEEANWERIKALPKSMKFRFIYSGKGGGVTTSPRKSYGFVEALEGAISFDEDILASPRTDWQPGAPGRPSIRDIMERHAVGGFDAKETKVCSEAFRELQRQCREELAMGEKEILRAAEAWVDDFLDLQPKRARAIVADFWRYAHDQRRAENEGP